MALYDHVIQSKAVIVGCQGHHLSHEEIALYQKHKPLGFILFARNVDSADQIKRLCDDLRESVGWYAPILIDQEGGRVARLREPLVPESPPFEFFGKLYQDDHALADKALRLNTELQASYLTDLGINVNCSPVADLRFEGAHDIIGNRSFGFDPKIVAHLCAIVAHEFLENGITPIAKHLPGHGRALADSHIELPRLAHDISTLRETDFKPFALLNSDPILQKAMWGMVAHIVYEAVDSNAPATISPDVVDSVLRGELNASGFLIADDIGMEALEGTYPERAYNTVVSGLDGTLACNHSIEELDAIMQATPIMSALAAQRFIEAETIRQDLAPVDRRDMLVIHQELDALLANKNWKKPAA